MRYSLREEQLADDKECTRETHLHLTFSPSGISPNNARSGVPAVAHSGRSTRPAAPQSGLALASSSDRRISAESTCAQAASAELWNTAPVRKMVAVSFDMTALLFGAAAIALSYWKLHSHRRGWFPWPFVAVFAVGCAASVIASRRYAAPRRP
jgi:hypothetical protein